MKEKSVRFIRSIAKIALLLCGIFLVLLGVYYTYRSIRFRPYKVRVSNVTDSAFTVSWVTDEPMVGVVYYGEKDTFLPGPLSWLGKKKAVDDRDVSDAQTECVSKFNKKVSKTRDENFTVDASGFDCHNVKVFKKGNYYTHHVTVGNLDADKEYFFRVGNGYISYKKGKTEGVKYIEREMPSISEFKQSTKPLITEVSSPKPAYGTSYNVYYTNDGGVGEKKNFDSLIFLRTFKSGDEYPLMSAVTNIDGGWSIDLSNVRNSDGKPLDMEDTYLEFIPQVDNARPGASGTTKFEALTFPLNLMGNNVDDLNNEKGEEAKLGARLKNLVSGVLAYGYDDEDRVECWRIGDCQYGVYQNSCPYGYTPTKSKCKTESVPPPKPNPWCCTSSCSCTDKYAQCPGGFTQYASKSACENAKQTSKVSCCSPSGQSDCICITNRESGSCGGSYPQEYNTNDLSEAKKQCKAKLPPVTNNCYTYKESDNSCDGPKACTSGTLSFRQCEDKRKEKLNLPTKTCCKITGVKKVSGVAKADCSCDFNQRECNKEGYTEYASKNACEGTSTRGQSNEGVNQVCEGHCVNGKKQYVVYRKGGGGTSSTNMLTKFFSPLGKLFTKSSYANGSAGSDKDPDGYRIIPTQESCDSQGSLEVIKETCTGSNCKKCWSVKDCFLVRVNKDQSCPGGYKEGYVCQPDPDSLTFGADQDLTYPNDQADTVRKNCVSGDRIKPRQGVTMTVVSGDCDQNCWAHYKNSDGSVCGNIRLDSSAYCENIHCSEKQKKTLTLGSGQKCSDISCGHEGGCVCPSDCGGGIIRNNQSCQPKEVLCIYRKQKDGNLSLTLTPNVGKGNQCPEDCSNLALGNTCYKEKGPNPCSQFIECNSGTDGGNGGKVSPNPADEGECYFIGLSGACVQDQDGVSMEACKGANGYFLNDPTCSGWPSGSWKILKMGETCPEEEDGKCKCFDNHHPYTNIECNTAGVEQYVKSYNPTEEKCNCPEAETLFFYAKAYKSDNSEVDVCVPVGGGGDFYSTSSDGCNRLTGEYTLKEGISYFGLGEDEFGYIYKGYEAVSGGASGRRISGQYSCCEFATGSYGIIPNQEGKVNCSYQANGWNTVLEAVDWGTYCKPNFFKFLYCLDVFRLKIYSYFYPASISSAPSCPGSLVPLDRYGGVGDTDIFINGKRYMCYNGSLSPFADYVDLRFPSYLEKCVTDGGLHPDVKGVSIYDPSVLGVTDGEVRGVESKTSFLYFPESGMYDVASTTGGTFSTLGDAESGMFFYKERNDIPGFQFPEDLNNPRENEDLPLDQSSVVLDISQKTSGKQYTLKKGVNIMSFDIFPSEGENVQLMSNRFLELINQSGQKVSNISYFSGSQWAGGTTYDFKTGETKGAPFPLSQGKGYIVVAERDTTITVPGYKTETPIPIAFSSGWNLIGVHGHNTAYTAKSLINSVNSIEGLQANNVTYWPTSKGMYQGFQLSEGQEYGQDFPISKDLGYFVRINDFKALKEGCKSINWNPGGQKNGECN